MGKDGTNTDVLLFILAKIVTFRMLFWVVILCCHFCVVFLVWFSGSLVDGCLFLGTIKPAKIVNHIICAKSVLRT